RREPDGGDDRHPTIDEIGSHCGQALVLSVRPAIFNVYILAFDKAAFLETPEERFQAYGGIGRSGTQIANHRQRRPLLRARPERPQRRRCHRGEPRDEVAPSHSITSSAMDRRSGGTARPSARAVCRLMANTNLVD